MPDHAPSRAAVPAARGRWTADIDLDAQRRDVAGFRAALRQRLRQRVAAPSTRPTPVVGPVDDACFAELAWYAVGNGLTDDDARVRAASLVSAAPWSAGAVRVLPDPERRPWLAAALVQALVQLRHETGEAPHLWLGTSIATFANARLAEALAALQQVWPAASESVAMHCEHVVWLDGDRYHSMTMPYAFGAVLIRPRLDMTVGEFAEALLHESAHLEMYVRQSYDPMVHNPLTPCRSPLRTDARPVIAVLHAAYVLSRMIEGHRRWLAGPAMGIERERSIELERRHSGSLRAALDELARTADFTEAGAALFASLRALRSRSCA